MKRVAGFIILSIVMLAQSQQVQAQFWKKIFQKKAEEIGKPIERKAEVKEREPDKKISRRRNIHYPATEKKDRYRVDVLIPLYLNELVKDGKVTFKGKVPEKTSGALDFYEGVKLAADTLNSSYYNIDIYIHDIGDPANAPAKLIKSKALDNTDLIIGLTQSQDIPELADFAKTHHVNFVSALSPSDGDVRENPYFILMQPTLQTHCRAVVRKIEEKHKNDNPLLFYRTSLGVDEEAYNFIIEDTDNAMPKLLCNELPQRGEILPLLHKDKPNVILMALLDYSYAEKILYQLHRDFPDYEFKVYGMPSWRYMNSLKKADAYPNVAVYITTPFYFDNTTRLSKYLNDKYKQDLGSTNKPGELLYRGYETIYWFSRLLKDFGTIFNEQLDDNGSVPYTPYKIKQRWYKDVFYYNENTHLYIMRYQGSSYSVER